MAPLTGVAYWRYQGRGRTWDEGGRGTREDVGRGRTWDEGGRGTRDDVGRGTTWDEGRRGTRDDVGRGTTRDEGRRGTVRTRDEELPGSSLFLVPGTAQYATPVNGATHDPLVTASQFSTFLIPRRARRLRRRRFPASLVIHDGTRNEERRPSARELPSPSSRQAKALRVVCGCIRCVLIDEPVRSLE